MAPLATYNKAFLNKLFTTKEFDFINSIDNDIKNIDSLINNEEKIRDVIVSLINKLQDATSENSNKNSSEMKKSLSKLEDYFEILNKDIQLLQDCKQKIENINVSIIELLVKIDSENNDDAKNKFENEIIDLKNTIINFSSVLEKNKSDIFSNKEELHKFLETKEIASYLQSFSISFTPENDEQPITSNKQNTEVLHIESPKNNSTLIISEKDKKVYLPYSQKELTEYIAQYPNQYSSIDDVIEKEFILPIDFYVKHPVVARFRESYSLIRDKESRDVIDALKFSIDLMFKYELNPAIIAACKSQNQLENYLSCLDNKNLDDFKDFEIKFEISPLKV